MRILFFMSSFSGYFRQFDPVMRELLARGHQVHVARDRDDVMRGDEWANALAAELPGFTWGETAIDPPDPWKRMRRHVRRTRDYLRYLGSDYAECAGLARRSRHRVPAGTLRMLDSRRTLLERPANLRRLTRALERVERAMPAPPASRAFIGAQAPDLVLMTPNLMPGALHQDHLRAARELGLPTALGVASWDNLSTKQIIFCEPDVTLVWNQTQKREAVTMHRLAPERVLVTGAPVYDQWFDWPARERAEFCARVGLAADRPYVLYLGGSLFRGAMTEAQFAEQWIRALRASDRPELRDISVLVRPHPKTVGEWAQTDLSDLAAVAVWPREGRMPVAEEAKADLFDSMHHSAAVAGLNTSAMIEAGIAGKRVLAPLIPEFADSQGKTLHFRYLNEVGGGLLHVSPTLEHHVEALADAVSGEGDPAAENRGFLEEFVRPQGLDRPSTPLFVDELERAVTATASAMAPEPVGDRVLRAALQPVRLGFQFRVGQRARRLATGPTVARVLRTARGRTAARVGEAEGA